MTARNGPGNDGGPLGQGGRSSSGLQVAGAVTDDTPLEAVERACDAAFLTLLGAGYVGGHPEDLVVATLRRIMVEAHALQEDASPARRWWAA